VVLELIEFCAAIGDIYDAAVDPALWQQALAIRILAPPPTFARER
jgi:hypothetical protein